MRYAGTDSLATGHRMHFPQWKRRQFISLLGGAAGTWPLAGRAQQSERVRRVGVLIGVADDAQGQARLAAFRRGLQALGWTEGRNLLIVARFAPDDVQRQAYAEELVRLAPDVILANTTLAARALLNATKTIPIVFAQLPDPVADGLVSRAPAAILPASPASNTRRVENGLISLRILHPVSLGS
jgi:putative ABC transport system substrate-binding protein